MSENSIEFSYTGKPEHKELWALCPATGSETIRMWALSLLSDMRDRHAEAVVWINGRKFDPTAEEVAVHQKHIATIMEKQRLLYAKQGIPDVVEAEEEPQAALEVAEPEELLVPATDGLLIDPSDLADDLDF